MRLRIVTAYEAGLQNLLLARIGVLAIDHRFSLCEWPVISEDRFVRPAPLSGRANAFVAVYYQDESGATCYTAEIVCNLRAGICDPRRAEGKC